MKRIILVLLLTGIFTQSCKNDDDLNSNTELIGNWKLVEIFADPGDGSGIFQSVDSNKTLQFKVNEIVTTNGSLCNPYSEEIISSGTFDENIINTGCQNSNISTIRFELKNNFLILNFLSNEGYSEKYVKINYH